MASEDPPVGDVGGEVPFDPRHRAAAAVLDELVGTGTDVVVRDGLSLLVRRGPVLARVRPEAEREVATREVRVARALAAAGVPAVALVEHPGGPADVDLGPRPPWSVEACSISAWGWVDSIGSASPAQLGALAAILAGRTATDPAGPRPGTDGQASASAVAADPVPAFDPFAAILAAVAPFPIDDPQARFVRDRAVVLAAGWPEVVATDPGGTALVHGDLHVDNVLVGADGPLLADLELAGVGPPSYDVAPAVVAVARYGAPASSLDAFLDAYGRDPRPWPGFATCVDVYELWVTAWAVGVREGSPDAAAEADLRVRCLRTHACEPWHLR